MTAPFLQQLLTLPTVLSAQVSPDRRWVAFVWYRVHENRDVFIVPSDGSVAPQPLTHTPEATNLVGWTGDSQAVIVSEDHNSNERLRLYLVDLAHPGVLRPLTEDAPPYFLRGGSLSPDKRSLYYGANYDFEKGESIGPTWIVRHDLHSGKRFILAKAERPAYTIPELNSSGSHLIYARKDRHPSGRQYHIIDVNGVEDREFLNFGNPIKTFARWFPDGEHILALAEATHKSTVPQGYNSVGVYHWPSQSLRWLIDDPQRSIEGAWVSPDGTIIIDEVIQASRRPSYLDIRTGSQVAFPRLAGNLIPSGRLSDGSWAALYYSATDPIDLVRLEWEPHGKHTITSLSGMWQRTDLDRRQLTVAEDFRWHADDGQEIQGWLYRARPNPCRAVIQIHGGPTHHAEDRLDPQVQYLVSRDFNVLDVNYRGSTGFGLPFREVIKEDGWGGREQNDIVAGAQALISAGLAKAGRVGVTGASFGGYSAWFLITHTSPEVIRAAAPICGMTDLVIDYYTTRPDLRPLSEEMMGGSPEQAPQRYFERSPINFVANISGALLIVQGAQDPNVTPENVHNVVQQLEAHHIAYDLLIFEDEGHGIKKPANQQVLFTRLAEFFERSLGGSTVLSRGAGTSKVTRKLRRSGITP